ncbi:unnamed protein product [Ostreobium quekettii]|uniref:Uncharacterized protein n=1 Tax=Ostreobium quekettii TaxID=121088 RepID=A0A8S1JF13_9CHLO|nr:unnamed protein product [Ostreobium quekettii]
MAPGSLGWKDGLRIYVHQRRTAGEGYDDSLARAVLKRPKTPDAWLALLIKEEAEAGDVRSTERTGASIGGREMVEVTISHLYRWATKEVPFEENRADPAYWDLQIGYARRLWGRERTGRTLFKDLICESKGRYAPIFLECAGL